MEKVISKEEAQKRQAVFTKPRKTVLVKILAMGVIGGLPKKNRNEETIDSRHSVEAALRGVDFQAYREKGDTGFCLFQKEEDVRITTLLAQLRQLGLRYIGGHWQQNESKGPVNTLQFSTEGEELPIPLAVRRLLSLRFNHCTVWCNLRYAVGNGSGQHRLDTINLAKGKAVNEPARELVVDGSTYRLR